jgi:predicted nucleic acid-binding protein
VPDGAERGRACAAEAVYATYTRDGLADFYQPPHFIAEVAAVLARTKPDEARADLCDLKEIDCRIIEDAAIHQTALDLAIRLDHHLFDTLNHAVALHAPSAVLVTADRRYFAKAQSIGHILLLDDPTLTALDDRDA